MTTVFEIKDLTKSYGDKTVVNQVSFSVNQGELFGFLGPNGSGKTTTIRMALDIIRPESGQVTLFGGVPPREALPNIGYLPEDRGLLRKVRVLDILRYLGRLKGLSAAEAEDRGKELLHRIGLYEHRAKKIEGLSRGMMQLIQFAASLLHQPELIILDEPFSGLDPLNVQLMKEMLREQTQQGATIIFSTHIMSDVEELCQRVALIADGNMLLYGDLDAIKHERGANGVRVVAKREAAGLHGGLAGPGRDGVIEYFMNNGNTPESILRAYLDEGIPIEKFELMLPTLNDIFIEEVSRARQSP